jgi:hypothetical protein
MDFDANLIRSGFHRWQHAIGMPGKACCSLWRWCGALILSVINTSVTRIIVGHVACRDSIPHAVLRGRISPRAFPTIFP